MMNQYERKVIRSVTHHLQQYMNDKDKNMAIREIDRIITASLTDSTNQDKISNNVLMFLKELRETTSGYIYEGGTPPQLNHYFHKIQKFRK